MVVSVHGEDIKHHSPIELSEASAINAQSTHYLRRLLIAIRTGGIEIKVGHAAQRLHVYLATVLCAVEPTRHKMMMTAFLI